MGPLAGTGYRNQLSKLFSYLISAPVHLILGVGVWVLDAACPVDGTLSLADEVTAAGRKVQFIERVPCRSAHPVYIG
jgi:hypothetical protein